MNDPLIRNIDWALEAAWLPDCEDSKLDLLLSHMFSLPREMRPTASLDDATAFHRMIVPGWWISSGQCGLGPHASTGPDRAFTPEPTLSRFDAGFHADFKHSAPEQFARIVVALEAKKALHLAIGSPTTPAPGLNENEGE
jgi:hypothetical protein